VGSRGKYLSAHGFADKYLSLDLTAASSVHLLEPQWNPSLEEQALARVHRLGQTRLVTAIRYVMENSFEEVTYSAAVMKWIAAGYSFIAM
jgi:hypothetical protein